MRHVRLIATSDEYDSDLGVILKGTPKFDELMADRSGILLAHDLLEHQNGTAHMGPVWDELEALGGVWQVRGRHGDMMRDRREYHSVEANIASDISRMFGDYLAYPDTGPKGLAVGSRPHLYDEEFQACIEIARQSIPREHTDIGNGDPEEDANGWTAETHALLEEYLALALHRMRAGFRKAERRFGEGYGGADLFRAVRDAVKACQPDYEGQEFILSYGNGEASCREAWEA